MKSESKPELWAKKSLSQNFLVNPGILDNMEAIVAASLSKSRGPFVIEVGPGTGALTERILKHHDVVAIEMDPRAVDLLGHKFPEKNSQSRQLIVRKGDVLREDLNTLVPWAKNELGNTPAPGQPLLVGNLPYAISSDFLLWACRQATHFSEGHFLLQREVSARLSATTGSKAYGRLGVLVSLFFEVVEHFDVPPNAFVPEPKVTSRFLSLRPKGFRFATDTQQVIFERLTAELFSKRRKMLRGVLPEVFRTLDIPYDAHMPNLQKILADCGVEMTDRPERIPPEGFLQMARYLGPR